MKINRAFWMSLLTLFLAAAVVGVGYAQSAPASALVSDAEATAHAASHETLVASVLSNAVDPVDVQVDTAGPDSAEEASAEPAEPTKTAGRLTTSKIGIGVKISTLGAGIEVATQLGERFNLRGGFNMFRYSRPISYDGIQYDGQLRFQSAEAHFDWFPIGEFHVSPGVLFYNGNEVTATAMVPGGQTFSEGGTTYESDPNMPVNGAGKLDFVKVSPSIMIGYGNLIPRNGRHFSFLFEIGGAYQGNSRVALNLTGNVCDTTGAFCRSISSDSTVQANIQAQRVKIQNEVNPYRFYPVVSIGFGFNF